ncbi:hypothetical protein SAMN05660860_01161 [Geoalkalibacter ferrihydriticus]|uniref:AXH domain-containing protein n=2 Tax=Geoalkalibacter ferrihydriticus TaxID=392333 RepID=A0A0C2HY83_9BACT|nr:hypothetical protein [Geoalkalibacter ferrihydriticus]KIH77692.1 hypothetical protein GFER_03235 [Geoalkalibacter ferrihydriticus DSM 17813]SDL73970.1 hypothetical protein SAMN05660860_01161 [Geoalkalibacter ferrihydriticus]
MKCPVCKNSENHSEIDVRSNGFDEKIIACDICDTIWSVNHGANEIVKDAQAHSFLEATSESVEGNDYAWST